MKDARKELMKLSKAELVDKVINIVIELDEARDENDRLSDSYCDLESDYANSINADDLEFDIDEIESLQELSSKGALMSDYDKERFKDIVFNEFGLTIEIK